MKGFRLASLIVMSFIPNVPGLAPVPDVGICFSSPAVCSSKGLLHSRPSGNTCIGRSSLSVAPLSSRSRSSRFLISASAVGSSSDVGLEDVKKKRRSIPFTLRRARPHELDLLAILSTEAFTPKGAWFDVVQRIKFLLVRWDLQAQFHQRFYSWDAVVKDFKPPITESRYALLAAAKSNGNAIGVTELCVAPNPVKKDSVEEMGLGETAPYLSNLAVDKEFRRMGVGQALVKECEKLCIEWGHDVLSLHVDESNKEAINFYRGLDFFEAPREMSWYDSIGREDLQVQRQLLLVKRLQSCELEVAGGS